MAELSRSLLIWNFGGFGTTSLMLRTWVSYLRIESIKEVSRDNGCCGTWQVEEVSRMRACNVIVTFSRHLSYWYCQPLSNKAYIFIVNRQVRAPRKARREDIGLQQTILLRPVNVLQRIASSDRQAI